MWQDSSCGYRIQDEDTVSFDITAVHQYFAAAWEKYVMIKSVNENADNIFVCSLATAAPLWVKSLMHNQRKYACNLVNIPYPMFLSCCVLSVMLIYYILFLIRL